MIDEDYFLDEATDVKYMIQHGGKSAKALFNIRVLVDNFIAYSRLPPLVIGKEYEFNFKDLLAIGVTITNIYCLPDGLV